MTTYRPRRGPGATGRSRRLTPALVRLQRLGAPHPGPDEAIVMLPCAALTPALNVIGPLARVSVFSWGVRIEARWWPLRAVFGRWQVRYEDLAQVRLARFAETAPTRWVRLVRHDGTAPALCGTRCPGALLEAIHAAGGPVVDGTERVDWIDAEEHVAKAGR